jgi:hypothetical protein
VQVILIAPFLFQKDNVPGILPRKKNNKKTYKNSTEITELFVDIFTKFLPLHIRL